MKMRDTVIFILAVLILSGCASLRDTRQSLPLACSSKKCQVEISQTGETLNAPGVYEFKRQKELNLTFRSENESIKKSVQGEIRWKESVLPNSLFALLGPGGWFNSAGAMAIDWYVGS